MMCPSSGSEEMRSRRETGMTLRDIRIMDERQMQMCMCLFLSCGKTRM